MNDSERNRLIEKIRKVLALSSSPNEAEAMAAASKAQAMLAEYNLSMSDVTIEEKSGEDFIEDSSETSESVPWRRQVAVSAAKLYFCEYFFTHTKKNTPTRACGYIRSDIHTFIGAAHNVLVAKMMFKYLTDTIDRLATEGSMKVLVKERSAYRTSFKWSCTLRLGKRIQDRIEAAKRGEIKSESGANLPALLDLYARNNEQIKSYMSSAHPVMRKGRNVGATRSHLGGALDGHKAGNEIGLDPQVSGQGANLLSRNGS